MSEALPPERCPQCRTRVVRRIAGFWCPSCRGWLVLRPILGYQGEGTVANVWGIRSEF